MFISKYGNAMKLKNHRLISKSLNLTSSKKFSMNLQEYQAQAILKKYTITTPNVIKSLISISNRV